MLSSHRGTLLCSLAMLPAMLPAMLLTLLLVGLLSGCDGGATNGASQTPIASSSASPSAQLSPIVGTPISSYTMLPVSSVLPTVPTVSAPDAVDTAQARYRLPLGPTSTSTSTIDPSLPTSTPKPTFTPRPTFTATPPPILLTDAVADPRQPGVQYFPQTGHTLRGVFLDYWNKHGSLAQLGPPITEEFVEYPLSGGHTYKIGESGIEHGEADNGKTTLLPTAQYFEQARLELPGSKTASADASADIVMTPGGAQLARQKGYFNGLYPRFGHAVDFSWVAGLYDHNEGMCGSCGCTNVLYTLKTLAVEASVLPYGSKWDIAQQAMLDVANDRASKGLPTNKYPYVVILGRMTGDPINHPGAVCGAPRYLVERLQQNPMP